jgi:hypothetical protein
MLTIATNICNTEYQIFMRRHCDNYSHSRPIKVTNTLAHIPTDISEV